MTGICAVSLLGPKLQAKPAGVPKYQPRSELDRVGFMKIQ